MHKLYTDYAQVYHHMYPGLIDYNEEFAYYSKILNRFHRQSILEVACGTGQLGKRLVEAGYKYEGLDLSAEMLIYARELLPEARFHEQDMRKISLPERFDAVLITARSVSHLNSNYDFIDTFQGIKNVLQPGGILVFDFIDASSYIPHILAHPEAVHAVGKFKRESQHLPLLDKGWRWLWRSQYFQEDPEGIYHQIGADECELRCFTADEMSLLLQLGGLEVLEINNRPSYAFDTKVAIAQNKE